MENNQSQNVKNGPETPSDELPDDMDMNLEEEKSTPDDKQARLEYMKSVVPPSKPAKKWPVMVLAGLIIVAILGGGGYLLYTKQHHQTAPTTTHKSQTVIKTIAPPSTSTVTAGMTHYVSNGQDLNLAFDYPNNWTVTPPSGDNANDQTITLNSPPAAMTSGSTAATGKVTVTIRPGSAGVSELSSGSAKAAQASVQFAYSQPTSSQHQYPYLSFIHLPGDSGGNTTFSGVLITGLTQFAQGASITQASVSVDPIIAANFYSCSTTACTGSGAAPMSITNDTWQNNSVCQQTMALFKSLQLH